MLRSRLGSRPCWFLTSAVVPSCLPAHQAQEGNGAIAGVLGKEGGKTIFEITNPGLGLVRGKRCGQPSERK